MGLTTVHFLKEMGGGRVPRQGSLVVRRPHGAREIWAREPHSSLSTGAVHMPAEAWG